MRPEKILFPIDVRRCPLDVFPVVNGLASRLDITVTLLHVVTLNILSPESRIYDELLAEARWFLDRLVRQYLPDAISANTRVRVGNATEEILAEVQDGNADQVILPSYGPSFWQRLVFLWKCPLHPMVSPLVMKIMRTTNCGLFIASTRSRFDCERAWGRPTKESLAGLNGIIEWEPEASVGNSGFAACAERSPSEVFNSSILDVFRSHDQKIFPAFRGDDHAKCGIHHLKPCRPTEAIGVSEFAANSLKLLAEAG